MNAEVRRKEIMPRGPRQVYKRGSVPIGHTDVDESDSLARATLSHADWEILAQQTLEERRKEKRVNLRFAVQVTGTSSDGKPFCEDTFTSDVSATGCKIELEDVVARGDMIAMKLMIRPDAGAPLDKPQLFQILWRACKEGIWTVGAKKLTDDKFWHMEFPEKSPFKAS